MNQLDLRQAAQLGDVSLENDYITGEGHSICVLTGPHSIFAEKSWHVIYFSFSSSNEMTSTV